MHQASSSSCQNIDHTTNNTPTLGVLKRPINAASSSSSNNNKSSKNNTSMFQIKTLQGQTV